MTEQEHTADGVESNSPPSSDTPEQMRALLLVQGQVIGELQKRAETSETSVKRLTTTVLIGSVCSVSVAVLAIVVGVWLLRHYPLEKYLWTQNSKVMCEANLSEEPLVTTNTVTEFAKDCALDMNTMAYDSVERDYDRFASRCLTPGFRKNYFESPALSERVDVLRNGLLRVNAQTTGPVLIASSGPTAQGYRWQVQVPIKRTFRQGETVKGSNERVYEIDVYRTIQDAFNPVGLGINQVTERTMVR